MAGPLRHKQSQGHREGGHKGPPPSPPPPSRGERQSNQRQPPMSDRQPSPPTRGVQQSDQRPSPRPDRRSPSSPGWRHTRPPTERNWAASSSTNSTSTSDGSIRRGAEKKATQKAAAAMRRILISGKITASGSIGCGESVKRWAHGQSGIASRMSELLSVESVISQQPDAD